jgi:hypothetical protein
VVFGERAAILQPAGSAYALLLRIPVHPCRALRIAARPEAVDAGHGATAVCRQLGRVSVRVVGNIRHHLVAGARHSGSPPASVVTPDATRAQVGLLNLRSTAAKNIERLASEGVLKNLPTWSAKPASAAFLAPARACFAVRAPPQAENQRDKLG